jgi:hypothetical protein
VGTMGAAQHFHHVQKPCFKVSGALKSRFISEGESSADSILTATRTSVITRPQIIFAIFDTPPAQGALMLICSTGHCF